MQDRKLQELARALNMYHEEGYDTAQICRNGHRITSRAHTEPQHRAAYCKQCGAATMTECDRCTTPIRGFYHSGDIVNFGMGEVPAFCLGCGEPYPWTENAIKVAQELAAELDGLNREERAQLKETIPDLVRDTPRTQLAVLRFQKLLTKAKPQAAEALKEVVVGVAVETVKRIICGA